MPPLNKNKFFILIVLFLSIGLGFVFAKKIQPAPLQTLDTKPSFLKSSFSSKGNSQRLLNVKIEFDEVKKNDEATELRAYIVMPFNFNKSLQFKWKLGEGVSLVDGLLEGSIEGLSAGVRHEVKIKVIGFSKEQNHQVAFEVFGEHNQHRIHGNSLVASDIESTFENTVQNVEHIKANQ